jgi:hypothetical protein
MIVNKAMECALECSTLDPGSTYTLAGCVLHFQPSLMFASVRYRIIYGGRDTVAQLLSERINMLEFVPQPW